MSTLSRLADDVSGGALTHRDFRNRFDRYLSTGQWQEGDGESLTDAFLRSGGIWLTEATEKAAAVAPQRTYESAPDTLGLWNEPGSFERALTDLNRDGYAVLDVMIPDAMVDELAAYFAAGPSTLTSDMPTGLEPGQQVAVDFDTPLAEKYLVDVGYTLNSAAVRSLLLDRGLLRIAQAYIGSAPIIDIIVAWFSFPAGHTSHQAGQLYHFDLDRTKWLKAFLLLTDQDAETGAHMYVPGTQRDKGIAPALLKRGYARLEDDEVAAHHPQESWKLMEGRRGVILLEDTRGLHKGLPVVRDHRLMLQFEYAQNLFGHAPHLASVPLPTIQDATWEAVRQECPELFRALDR